MIKLKRAYDPQSATDGLRILVERLWPRGIRKADLRLDGWPKDVAPSTELRKWFAHDPAKWTEFQHRYFAELDSRPGAWQQILETARSGTVTLIYSSHNNDHNNASALARYLAQKLRRQPDGRRTPKKAA